MSGLQGTIGLAQSALQASAAGAATAGQQAGTNMNNLLQANTERQRIAAEMITSLAKTAASMYTGGVAGGGGGISGGGSHSQDGAKINYFDKTAATGPASAAPGGTGTSGLAPGATGHAGAAPLPAAPLPAAVSQVPRARCPAVHSLRDPSIPRTRRRWLPRGATRSRGPDLWTVSSDRRARLSGRWWTLQNAVFGKEDVQGAQQYGPLYMDLLTFEVPAPIVANLTARSMSVQHYEDAIGDLNLDLYSIQISRLPTIGGSAVDAAGLLAHIRTNCNSFIDTGNSEFLYYDPADEAKWLSNDPLGTVFKIDIFGPDNAAVVCSLFEPTRWRFTTIRLARHRLAPRDRPPGVRVLLEWSGRPDRVHARRRPIHRRAGDDVRLPDLARRRLALEELPGEGRSLRERQWRDRRPARAVQPSARLGGGQDHQRHPDGDERLDPPCAPARRPALRPGHRTGRGADCRNSAWVYRGSSAG